MPTCYFHFRNRSVVEEDDIGVEFQSLEEAYLGAFDTAQEMWTELLRQRTDPLGCSFEIAGHTGRLLLTEPFDQVLRTAQVEQRQKLARSH